MNMTHPLLRRALLALLLCTLAIEVRAQPVVETPADATLADGLCSLREAIANISAGSQVHADCAVGSVIAFDATVFPVGSVTPIALGAPLVLNPTGGPALIILDGDGRVALDGQEQQRVLDVLLPVAYELRLFDLVVRNGRAPDGQDGGGLYVRRGSVVLAGTRFEHNTAVGGTPQSGFSDGAAIFAIQGAVIIDDSVITGSVGRSAVMVDATASLTVRGSQVVDNEGVGLSGGVDLSDSVVARNTGAGVRGASSIFRSRIAANGGAGIDGGGNLIVERSLIDGNQNGGIVGLGSNSVLIRNSTISGNVGRNDTDGSARPGGIQLKFGTSLEIVQSTIWNNTVEHPAPRGASLQVLSAAIPVSSVHIRNSLIGDPHGSGNCYVNLPALVSIQDDGGNWQNGDTGCFATATLGGDAMVSPLQPGVGNELLHHVPLPGSPLVDAAACPPLSPGLLRDQRNVPRPQGALCDIGAVELRRATLALTVSGSGHASATATAWSGGVSACGSAGGASCSGVYGEGPVTLQVEPGHAASWGGDCAAAGTSTQATVTLETARNCSVATTPGSDDLFANGFE